MLLFFFNSSYKTELIFNLRPLDFIFMLIVAVVTALPGATSPAALATTVDVLAEVLVMLLLEKITN
jgi:ACR3 family arsenite efflux pump ArsB